MDGTFVESLRLSSRPFLKILFGSCSSDLSSVTGNNIWYLLNKYETSDVKDMINDKTRIKSNRVYSLEDDNWKVSLIKEISMVKKNFLELDFGEKLLEEILQYICTE